MKDLLLYVADADAEAFMNSILKKPSAIMIRRISFDTRRHPQRDAGMVQSGCELARMLKGNYQKAILLWDHHGSGRDHKQTPDQVREEMQKKLDSFTWSGNSSITILVPELEQWLWYCENALCSYLKIGLPQLNSWLEDRSEELGRSVNDLKGGQPKELFEYVMRSRLRRTISPRDFSEIGKLAGVSGLMNCGSFRAIVEALQGWFPPQ